MTRKAALRRPGAMLLLASALACGGLGLTRKAIPAQAQNATPAGSDRSGYVGDASCLPCHRAQSESYKHTAHALTSQTAGRNTVRGSFDEAGRVLMISDPVGRADEPRLFFQMETKPDGLYQTAVAELGEKKLTTTRRFDITIGSGVRGQTYLYWKDDQLFELPVSYWTEGHQWINSPGYRDGTANFERHVDPRCMECHTSFIYARSDDPQTNLYDRGSLILGIGCETCHGPGAAHIALESKAQKGIKPASTAILNPAHFSRDGQVDGCALCHNGTAREELQQAFSYRPGEPLDKYLAPNPLDAADQPDVHGNQVGLLKRSRCFRASPAMSCSTCHDEHAPERVAASYSNRCMSCHQWQTCGASRILGDKVKANCVDCHMPLRETQAIVSVTAGKVVRASIRTHWIKVYPETMPVTP